MVGMLNDAAALENSLAVSKKVQESYHITQKRYIAQRDKNPYPYKNLYSMFMLTLFIIAKK